MNAKIKSVKLRFEKWHHSTDKAHLLTYQGKQVWVPKKLAWNFLVAGNDLHAWAVVPSWLFEKITGEKAEDAVSCGDAMADTIIEHHTPDAVAPVTEVESLKYLSK